MGDDSPEVDGAFLRLEHLSQDVSAALPDGRIAVSEQLGRRPYGLLPVGQLGRAGRSLTGQLGPERRADIVPVDATQVVIRSGRSLF